MDSFIRRKKIRDEWNFAQEHTYTLIHTVIKAFFKNNVLLAHEEWKYFKSHIFNKRNEFYDLFQNMPESFVCPKCSKTIDRDLNAAINLKNEALRQYSLIKNIIK